MAYPPCRPQAESMAIALLLAIGPMAANWFILLFAPMAPAAIRLVVVPIEEQALLATFGDEYRDFMRRTGCLLPRGRGAGDKGARGLPAAHSI